MQNALHLEDAAHLILVVLRCSTALKVADICIVFGHNESPLKLAGVGSIYSAGTIRIRVRQSFQTFEKRIILIQNPPEQAAVMIVLWTSRRRNRLL